MAPAGKHGKVKLIEGGKAKKHGVIPLINKQIDKQGLDNGRQRPHTDMPRELQQLILDVFKEVFNKKFDQSLNPVIQEVKQHLFNRDFTSAFGKESFLDAYAIRWSPSRALAYLHIFSSLQGFLSDLHSPSETAHHAVLDRNELSLKNLDGKIPIHSNHSFANSQDRGSTSMKVVSLGGGAGAELVALAGFLHSINHSGEKSDTAKAGETLSLDVVLVDIADWSSVIARLHTGLTSTPIASSYSANATKSTSASLVSKDTFRVGSVQQDLLKMDLSQLGSLLQGCCLVTLMFTLNELYSTSISATTNLLLSMTCIMQQGSLLLVVDSPGSYSTVDVGRDVKSRAVEVPRQSAAQKKYPMLWLLEHTLLAAADVGSTKPAGREKQWEKLDGSESKWFRLPQGLGYPIDIEDMRYQFHLYKRI